MGEVCSQAVGQPDCVEMQIHEIRTQPALPVSCPSRASAVHVLCAARQRATRSGPTGWENIYKISNRRRRTSFQAGTQFLTSENKASVIYSQVTVSFMALRPT